MSKSEFKVAVTKNGVYLACLMANIAGVSLATVQLWLSSIFGGWFENWIVFNRIPEAIRQNWVNRIDVNSETSFEDQIKSLEEEYSTLVQVSADSGRYAPPAGGGNPNPSIDEKLVEKLVEEL